MSARTTAESAADKALKRLGMHQHEPPSTLSPDERTFRRELEAQKSQLANYQALVEQCAYEHWHRILFARFLAENELLIHPTAGVAVSLEDCDDAELQAEFGVSDAYELAARYAAQMLPAVFRPDDALLRVKLAPEDRIALEKLVKELPEAVFRADDSLGWTYQFWQKERKEQVNKAEEAVEGGDISAVTQLFTEHYMVRFLLENTIGAWWACQNPQTRLTKGWDYFKPEIPHDFSAYPTNVKEVTFIDPCCGSGHFLVEAFLLFQSMYRDQGMSASQAGDAAIEHNIRGLELDPRCTQIAAFNVAIAAWRYGGYRTLPEIQIACTGMPLKGSRTQWEKLAQGDSILTAGMALLHDTFSKAADLGSLIHPAGMFDLKDQDRARQFTLDAMPDSERQQQLDLATQIRWSAMEGLLDKALAREASPEEYHAGVRAQGVAKAAQMLSDRYWFAVTNPPFLAVSKGGDDLKEFCNENHSDAKKDLATCFVERLRQFCCAGGEYALVCPQNWLFMGGDKKLRQKLLKGQRWLAVVRFGPGAFETITGEVVQAANLIFANRLPTALDQLYGLDASTPKAAADKAALLREATPTKSSDDGSQASTGQSLKLNQLSQLENPDYIIRLSTAAQGQSFGGPSGFVRSLQGIKTGDDGALRRYFWEVVTAGRRWTRFQGSPLSSTCLGAHSLVDLSGTIAPIARLQGQKAWGKRGVLVQQMNSERTTPFFGFPHDSNVAAIVPNQPTLLATVTAFCASDDFVQAVQGINQNMKVDNGYFERIPFALDHWQRVATERFPDGLPEPQSDDPTQWIFRGDIPSSIDPLQVAVARLLGYRWPDQPEGPLDPHADEDGIVTLAPLVNQDGIAGRLRVLLQTAYESGAPDRPKGAPEPEEPRLWNEAVIPNLLAKAGFAGMSFEECLRDKFFEAHCRLFQQRPFIWHIWDGRKDGFHAFVNYHKLDRKNLERLTHVYLGEWIERQRAAADAGDRTADARLIAAQELQKKLELIRTGEPPYDIFVRWKTLAEQPMGWDPDLNDGVRMNIRPFVEAGILRGKVNVNWNKDRGKDPKPNVSGTVERHNDLHFTLAEKQAAREAKG